VYRYRLRAEARRRWRSWIALALLAGVVMGVAIAAVAAARRTDTAYERFLTASRAHDLTIASGSPDAAREYDEIASLPGVALAGTRHGVSMVSEFPDGRVRPPAFVIQVGDVARFSVLDRPGLREGRLPDPTRPHEVLINPTLARTRGWHTGSKVRLLTGDVDTLSVLGRPGGVRALTRAWTEGAVRLDPVELTVTGVGVLAADALTHADSEQRFVVTPAFLRRYGPPLTWSELGVRLRPGIDVEEFTSAVRRIAPDEDVRISLQESWTRQADRAIEPDVTVLFLFAATMALAGLLLIGPAIVRQADADASEDGVLAVLGMTRGQSIVLGTLRGAPVALVGATIAALVAVLVSPLGPIGSVRAIEPDPGLAFDGVVLVGGAALVFVTILAVAAVSAVWRSRPAARAQHRSMRAPLLVRAVHRLGRGSETAVAAGFASGSAGTRTAVTARTTLAATAAGMALLVAVLVFGAGMDHLVATPTLYGWSSDLAVSGNGGYLDVSFPGYFGPFEKRVRDDAGVDAWTLVGYQSTVVDRRSVPTLVIGPARAYPTLLEGRPARAFDEIVLGTSTLQDLGKGVGDRVLLRVGPVVRRATVVGRAVLPELGHSDTAPTALGDGAVIAPEAIRRGAPANAFLVRAVSGPRGEQAIARLMRAYPPRSAPTRRDLVAVRPTKPAEIAEYDDLGTLRLALAVLLGGAVVAALAHGLAISGRLQRSELSALKALGCTRAQLRRIITRQALIVVAIALVVGTALGSIGGWTLWRSFAERIGVVVEPVFPAAGMAALVLLALATAVIVALAPARRAARVRPAGERGGE
jgi:hypothetical protein